MTEAAIESVPADENWARVHLARADVLIEDASSEGTSNAGQQILLYTACIALMEAVMQAGGRRVTPGVGHHQRLIEETERLLDCGNPSLFERLDDARATRNDASYSAGVVSEDHVASISSCAMELQELVRVYLQ